MKVRNILLLVVTVAAMNASSAADQSIILASTTSVEATGLLANILPQFRAKTGITVNVVAQGTGKALDTARRGGRGRRAGSRSGCRAAICRRRVQLSTSAGRLE
jgi:ABC-type tungstate transport system permease subunit